MEFVTKQTIIVDATGTVAIAAGELYYLMRLVNGSFLSLTKNTFARRVLMNTG